MKELEKILEEVGKLKKICEANAFSLMDGGSLPCIYDKSDIEFAKGYAFSLAIKIIRKHMNDGWIPVEGRLPEVGEYVLGTNKYDEVLIYRYGWNSSHTRKMFCHLCGAAATIIAWRPLPEPYIPERNDNHDRE